MYAMDSPVGRPLGVRFEESPAFTAVGAVQQPQPNEGHDDILGEDYTYFTDAVQLTRLYRAASGASGAARVAGAVTYMVCNDDICLPPKQHPFDVSVTVRASAVAAAPAPAADTPPAATPPRSAGIRRRG